MKPTIRHDESLTEDQIKKMTLSFLKAYYRKRQRAGETVVSSDMRGLGGIIADGYLTYPQEDGTWFIATFEATSLKKKHEVRYTIDNWILGWDSAALAAITGTVYLIWSYLNDYYTVKQVGLQGPLFALYLVFAVTALAHQLFSRYVWTIRRYRYIYAVEQFKQYYADEQWVAMGEDVLPDKSGRYFRELRHQCTYNGFGLIIINRTGEQLVPTLFITPARQQLSSRPRRVIRFFSENEFAKRVQQTSKRARKTGWSFRHKQQSRTTVDAEHTRHFKRRYHYQIIIILSCMALMIANLVRQWQERPVLVPDEDKVRAELLERKAHPTFQPVAFKLDTPYFYPPPFDRSVNPYLTQLAIEKSKDVPEPASPPETGKPSAEIIVAPDNNQFVYYDCSRFYNLGGTKYLIVEGIYEDPGIAGLRMSQINETGIEANVLWLGCFFEWDNGFAVYLDLIYNTSEEALMDMRAFEKILAPEEPAGWLEVRSISPLSGH